VRDRIQVVERIDRGKGKKGVNFSFLRFSPFLFLSVLSLFPFNPLPQLQLSTGELIRQTPYEFSCHVRLPSSLSSLSLCSLPSIVPLLLLRSSFSLLVSLLPSLLFTSLRSILVSAIIFFVHSFHSFLPTSALPPPFFGPSLM